MRTKALVPGLGSLQLLALLALSALGPYPVQAAEFFVEARSNNTFSPANLTIQAGDRVTWTNTGGTHNVEANDGSFRCANGCDGSGGNGAAASNAWSFSLTFDTPGTFDYFCVVHRGLGMTGQIVVEPGGGGSGSAGALRFSVATLRPNEGSGSVDLIAERIGGADGAVAVTYATADDTATAGSDYSATSGTLTWPDNNDDTRTVTVSILEDAAIEGTEAFTVSLGSPTGGATLGSPATTTVRIIDNDEETSGGQISFETAEITTDEAGGTAEVSVQRTGQSQGAVGADYTTSDGTASSGSDYSASSGTLSWADGEEGAKSFSVPITDDDDPELAESIGLTLSNPTGGATLGADSATLTILDDDVDFGPCVADAETLCLGENDRFRVQLRFTDVLGRSGPGQAVDIGRRDSGLIFFQNPNNIEMLVKILNACASPAFETYWVFYAATTNAEFTLTVVDTEQDVVQQYFNPLRNPAAPIQDTRAFATCP